MKKIIFLIIASISFSHLAAAEIKNNYSISADQITSEAKTADNGEKAYYLVNSALASGKLDVVVSCFRSPNLYGTFISTLEKMPISPFKEQVLLMLMQEPWPFDSTQDQPIPFGSPPAPRLQIMCIEMLIQKLPNEGLNTLNKDSIQKLSSLKSRKVLVEKWIKASQSTKKKDEEVIEPGNNLE